MQKPPILGAWVDVNRKTSPLLGMLQIKRQAPAVNMPGALVEAPEFSGFLTEFSCGYFLETR